MTDDFSTLAGTLDAAWAALEAGARDADAPARTPVVASVGATGAAEARMMVLRDASRTARRLEVQSDAEAAKVRQFKRSPKGTVLVWDAPRGFQIRARVTVTIRTGETAAEAWERIPDGAKGRYGGTPPGVDLSAPEAAEDRAEQARFAVLAMSVDEIETLVLGEPHRRAVFVAPGFEGRWIAP